MIIVETKNGAMFVNEKEITMMCHDKERGQASFHQRDTMQGVTLNDVESVTFISDAQPKEYKDEGSEIQRLKAELEEKDRKLSMAFEHFGFIREWFFIYENAFSEIKSCAKDAERDVNLLAIIAKAEAKYAESSERFEKVRKKWDEETAN